MKTRSLVGCLGLSVGLIATACGGSSSSSGGNGGGGDNFTSSVSGSTVLGSLSDADAAKICGELNAYAASPALKTKITVPLCKVTAVQVSLLTASSGTNSMLYSSCKTLYDKCTTTPSTSTTDTCKDKPTSACQATVAEYTACLNDTFNAIASAAAAVPACEALTTTTKLSSSAGAASPKSCDVMDQKCPEWQSMMMSSGF